MSLTWTSIPFIREESDEAPEPMGTKEKFWVALPSSDRAWLLKLARLDAHDGTVSGEDWAEWLVHHLAALVEVPTAELFPATLDERRAVLSRSVLRDDREYLDHGNSVLAAVFPGYDQGVKGENPNYTPAAVSTALDGVQPPSGVALPGYFTAFDAWTGYVMMDAWVAGRDRHHENWAVILRGVDRYLAPSFDHGNALGFQERDDRRRRMLDDPQHFERWAERGRSRHFAGRPGLVAVALQSMRLASPGAGTHWLDRLAAVDSDAVESIVNAVPDEIMSEVTRRFVVRLLLTNRRRLLDGYAGA